MTTRSKSRPHRRRSTFTGLLARSVPSLSSLLLAGSMLGAAPVATAHDVGSAAIRIVRQPSNTWVFELQTPLHGLDRSMRRFNEARSHDPGDLIAGSTRYKELVVEYVKATFELEAEAVDGNASPTSDPALGTGRIKLGDHVSVLIFEIENMPATLDELTLRLPYMADNPGQQNILRFVDGDRDELHVLREDNAFTVVDTDFFDSGLNPRQSPTPATTE